jgi:hypothetical protein
MAATMVPARPRCGEPMRGEKRAARRALATMYSERLAG